jgi:hypothetical protein
VFNSHRLVTALVIVLATASLAVTGVSCTPAQETGPVGPNDGQKPPEPQSEDITLDPFEEVSLSGARVAPAGLTVPGMVRVRPRRKTTIDKQRKAYAAAKPDRKALEAEILVTMLWEESEAIQGKDTSTAADKEKAKAMRAEAIQTLRDARASLGEQADPVLLQMVFTIELMQNNEKDALEAGKELMSRHPDSDSAKATAPWIVQYLLRDGQTDEAAAIVEGWNLDQLNPGADAGRAYGMAWVAFRKGEHDKAGKAIAWAAENWKSTATQPAIERDLVLMLTRPGTPVDDAADVAAQLAGGKKELQYILLYRLYEGYEAAGYSEYAAQALEKALQARGDEVPLGERVIIRQRQSNNYLIAHQPARTAEVLIAAYKDVGPCGEPCKGKEQEIPDQIKKLALHFHTTYTTTQDAEYYEPAKKLYEFYIGLNPADAATIKSYLTQLEETKERMAANMGKHDKTTMEWSTAVRSPVVKACYENALLTEPELKGTLRLMLDIDSSGEVAGATTEPAAGEEGLAAVGACVQERARAWKFPSRSKPGTTKVTRSYALSPEEA